MAFQLSIKELYITLTAYTFPNPPACDQYHLARAFRNHLANSMGQCLDSMGLHASFDRTSADFDKQKGKRRHFRLRAALWNLFDWEDLSKIAIPLKVLTAGADTKRYAVLYLHQIKSLRCANSSSNLRDGTALPPSRHQRKGHRR